LFVSLCASYFFQIYAQALTCAIFLYFLLILFMETEKISLNK
jgi:hypothetical protein